MPAETTPATAATPRRCVAQTQTDARGLEDLRALKETAAEQADELQRLRTELPRLKDEAERQLSTEVSATGAERDDRWSSRVRHLRDAHAQALEHARAAAAAKTANELAKQKDVMQRHVGETEARLLRETSAELKATQREAELLRGKLGLLEEDLAAAKEALEQERQALDAERERAAELRAEITAREAAHREREEAERRERERVAASGATVDASRLEAAEMALDDKEKALRRERGAREAAEAAALKQHEAALRLEAELDGLRASAERETRQAEESAGRERAEAKQRGEAMRGAAEKAKAEAKAAQAEAKRQVELCGLLTGRQADAIRKLTLENAELLKIVAGSPTLRLAVANDFADEMGPPPRRASKSADPRAYDDSLAPTPAERSRPKAGGASNQGSRRPYEPGNYAGTPRGGGGGGERRDSSLDPAGLHDGVDRLGFTTAWQAGAGADAHDGPSRGGDRDGRGGSSSLTSPRGDRHPPQPSPRHPPQPSPRPRGGPGGPVAQPSPRGQRAAAQGSPRAVGVAGPAGRVVPF